MARWETLPAGRLRFRNVPEDDAGVVRWVKPVLCGCPENASSYIVGYDPRREEIVASCRVCLQAFYIEIADEL